MGCYKKSNSTINPVLFDLIHVRELESPKTYHWIEQAMDDLFNVSQESRPEEEESDYARIDLWPVKDDICDALRNTEISSKADGRRQTADGKSDT